VRCGAHGIARKRFNLARRKMLAIRVSRGFDFFIASVPRNGTHLWAAPGPKLPSTFPWACWGMFCRISDEFM
jgi:hypothetical protein